MKKELTRQDFEKSLSYGKNYRPKEITDKKFYFFKGYLIELYKGGGFDLYKNRFYSSTSQGDILKSAMNKIIELEMEQFNKEQQLKEIITHEVQKRIMPFINDILQDVLIK